MDDPETTLDDRFSDSGATSTTWAETLETIKAAPVFWISTTRADRRPHVTPLVAVWLDDALHFSTGPTEQKSHNLQSTPDVVLTTGSDRWESGLDVMVEGRAVRVEDRATLQRLSDAWRDKWDGRWKYEVAEGGFRSGDHGIAHVFRVAPDKVLAFGKNPFTHTSHRFARRDASDG